MTLQINFSHTFVHKTDFYSELAALQQKDIDLALKKADVRWSSQKSKTNWSWGNRKRGDLNKGEIEF